MTTPNYSDAERELRRVEEIESAKMQDRTRAIVEAAERLAKAMNLDVSPHGCARYDISLEDGLTPEADDALLTLARALALPAEPDIDAPSPGAVMLDPSAVRALILKTRHGANCMAPPRNLECICGLNAALSRVMPFLPPEET